METYLSIPDNSVNIFCSDLIDPCNISASGTSSHKQLNVASINFQSICNKVPSFHEFMHCHEPDNNIGM